METIALASSFRSMVSAIGKKLRKKMHSADNLSLSELDTLSYLYPNEARSATELAALVMIKIQSMSELLIHLKMLDIVNKTPSADDKRKSLITLTAKGKQVVEQVRYERDEWLADAIDHHLSAEEKVILEQALLLIQKIREYK